jgi:hypothetical protein
MNISVAQLSRWGLFERLAVGAFITWIAATIVAFPVIWAIRAASIEGAGFWILLSVLVAMSFAAYWWLLGRFAGASGQLLRGMIAGILSLITYWAAITTVFALATIIHGA